MEIVANLVPVCCLSSFSLPRPLTIRFLSILFLSLTLCKGSEVTELKLPQSETPNVPLSESYCAQVVE